MYTVRLLTVMLSIICCSILQSQPAENHISLGYGLVNPQNIGSDMTAVFTVGQVKKEIDSSFGPLFISYERNLSEHFLAGVTMALYRDHTLVAQDDWNSSRDYLYEMDRTFFLIMAAARVNYYHSGSLRIYSRIAAGLNLHRVRYTDIDERLQTEKEEPRDLALQLDLLGFSIGRKVSFFGELSLGIASLLKFGLAVNF